MNSVTVYAPPSGFTAYGLALPSTPVTGIPHWTFSTPTVTETVSAITGSDCPTCVTSSSSLTSGNVVIGGGSQAANTTSTLQVGAGTPDVTVNQITSGDTMLLLKEVSGSSGGNMLDIQTNGGTRQFSVSQTGVVSNYNGSATAGIGVPPIIATKSVLGTAGNAATGAQTLFTAGSVGTSAIYRANYYMDQATVCVVSGGVSIIISWTDQNHGRNTSSISLNLGVTNTVGNNVSGVVLMNVAASTSIQWNTQTTGSCSTGSYDVYTQLERIQ